MTDVVSLSRDDLYNFFTEEYAQIDSSWEPQFAHDVNRSKITINGVTIEQREFSPTVDPLSDFKRRLNEIPEWEDLSEALYEPLCLIASQTIMADGYNFFYNRLPPRVGMAQSKIRSYSTNTLASNSTNTSTNSLRSRECVGNCITINIDSTGVYLFRNILIDFYLSNDDYEPGPTFLSLKLNMACKLQLSRTQPFTGSLHYFMDVSDFAESLREECFRTVKTLGLPRGLPENILNDTVLALPEDYPLKDKLRLYFSLKGGIPSLPRRNRTTVSHFRNSRFTKSSRVLNSARVSRVLNSAQIAKRGGRRRSRRHRG